MKRGLVIGKFYPPHNGHHYLIDTALKAVDELDLLVCDSPKYKIDAQRRAEWLQSIHPEAKVQIIQDLEDDDNSEAWANHTTAFLGYAPDIVFSSEDYGSRYASYLGCEHVLVDKERVTVPISATLIRSDTHKHWEFMKPAVRTRFATRIVVLGAESTGTTTLSLALAKQLKAAWTPEIGRYYTKSLLNTAHEWTDADFTAIASMQQQYEDTIAGESDGIVICDTNAFVTKLWQQRYMGHVTKDMEHLAANAPADLYIVTGDEIPFVQDGLRDGEHIRHDMHKQFVAELKRCKLPYIVVRGTVDERVEASIAKIRDILDRKAVIQ